MKICCRCKIEKPFTEYHKCNTRLGKGGIYPRCKQCKKETQKQYRDANLEKVKERTRLSVAKHRLLYPGKAKESERQTRAKYPDKYKELTKIYSTRQRVKRGRHRDNALPIWRDEEKIEVIYSISELKTICLGTRHHVDHIVPLVSKYVCGLHCEHNLQVLPAKENISKGNRWWPDMW